MAGVPALQCPTDPQDLWNVANFWANTPLGKMVYATTTPMMGTNRLMAAEESNVYQKQDDVKRLLSGTSLTTYAAVDGQRYKLRLAHFVAKNFCATCFPSFIYDTTHYAAKLYRDDSLIYRATLSSIDGGLATGGEQYEKHGTELIFARAIAQTLGCAPANQGYINEVNIRIGNHIR